MNRNLNYKPFLGTRLKSWSSLDYVTGWFKLNNQGIEKAIIVVPEKTIGASFNNEALTEQGFYWDWEVVPKWNLCNAPGEEGGKVNSVKAFLESDDPILVCAHATFRFAVERFGYEVFDHCLIAVDEGVAFLQRKTMEEADG